MKYVAIFVIIFAVSSFVRCDEEPASKESKETSSEELINEIIRALVILDESSEETEDRNKTIVGRSFESKCSGQGESIEKSIKESRKCIKEKNLEDNTVCHLIKNDLSKCMKPVEDEVAKCMPENLKYVPKLTMDTIIAVLSFVCDSPGSALLELGNLCIDLDATPEICKANIVKIVESIRGEVENLTKDIVCEAATKTSQCVHHVTTKCKNKLTKDTVQAFADAIVSPCNAA